ncbi:MAG: hypothetical protein M5U14_04310 [Acidimicrobiia bacterium]|nr:hypothetical protein [Acidimicrobiia bacterium]
MRWATLWGLLHTAGWSVHLGGAVAMELVWRPVQRHIPGSQTAVVCQTMGRRYRWLSAIALGLVGLSGVARLVQRGELDLTSPYGRTVVALSVVWLVLVATLALLAVVAHPALHVRTPASMTDEERAAARHEVRRAIERMDRLLRFELAASLLAVLLGASLTAGGL